MLKNFLKKESIAGLDIGSSYIKWVEVEGENINEIQVSHFAIEAIPKELTPENGNFKDQDVETVAALVEQCWRKSGSKNRNVAVALPPGQTITKKVVLQKTDTETEMYEQVLHAVVQYLPDNMAVNDMSVDYSIIQTNERNADDVDVIIVATKKDNLDNRLAIIEMAGLTPVIVDCEQFAIQNMTRLMRGVDFLNGTYVVTDCSGSMLRFWVFKNGELFYTKDTPIGGINMTQEIAKNLNLSYEEAEKKKFGNNKFEEEAEVYDMVEKAFLNNYVTEFVRSFAYIASATSLLEIDEIILTGGVAGLKRLPEAIIEALSENNEVIIKTNPYVAKPLTQTNKDKGSSFKINMNEFTQAEAGLFLSTSLALRKYLRQY